MTHAGRAGTQPEEAPADGSRSPNPKGKADWGTRAAENPEAGRSVVGKKSTVPPKGKGEGGLPPGGPGCGNRAPPLCPDPEVDDEPLGLDGLMGSQSQSMESGDEVEPPPACTPVIQSGRQAEFKFEGSTGCTRTRASYRVRQEREPRGLNKGWLALTQMKSRQGRGWALGICSASGVMVGTPCLKLGDMVTSGSSGYTADLVRGGSLVTGLRDRKDVTYAFKTKEHKVSTIDRPRRRRILESPSHEELLRNGLWFIQHSADPNCKIIELQGGKLGVVALRPILTGELLTIKYKRASELWFVPEPIPGIITGQRRTWIWVLEVVAPSGRMFKVRIGSKERVGGIKRMIMEAENLSESLVVFSDGKNLRDDLPLEAAGISQASLLLVVKPDDERVRKLPWEKGSRHDRDDQDRSFVNMIPATGWAQADSQKEYGGHRVYIRGIKVWAQGSNAMCGLCAVNTIVSNQQTNGAVEPPLTVAEMMEASRQVGSARPTWLMRMRR